MLGRLGWQQNDTGDWPCVCDVAPQTLDQLAALVKARLRALAGHRVVDDGSLLILARNHRTQEGNRREAEGRLAALIEQALVEPKVRRATRPTRASKERRLETKKVRSGTKAGRGRVRFDD